MCLSELFYFFWDSLGDPDKVLFWLVTFPICGYIGIKWNDLMERYIGWGPTGIIYLIVIISLFASGLIGWC